MNVTSTSQIQYSTTTNKTHSNKGQDFMIEEEGSNETSSVHKQEDIAIDNFLDDLYSNSSTATTTASAITKETIQNKVNEYAQLMMDERGTATESELQTSKLLNEYKKELLQEYKTSIESSTDTVMSAEQEAIIKVLMKENTQEISSLETLLATKTGTASTGETKATGKLGEMQEKYKDVYTPIPETYTKGSEELQMQKIYEAYPNYVPFKDVFRMQADIYTNELGEKPIQLGDKLTPQQEEKQKIAAQKRDDWIIEQYGSMDAWHEMIQGVYEIQKKYPVNTLAKGGDVKNATELTRFYNAAVYEGLESGKTIDDAKKDATAAREAFMDMSAAIRKTDPMFKGTDILYDNGKSFLQVEQESREVTWSAKWTWDLQDYGIEGDWHWLDVYDNKQQMTAEIQHKLEQYDFMLENKNLIEKANEELNPDDRNQINHYEKYIQDFKTSAKLALKVFNDYKIYD